MPYYKMVHYAISTLFSDNSLLKRFTPPLDCIKKPGGMIDLNIVLMYVHSDSK